MASGRVVTRSSASHRRKDKLMESQVKEATRNATAKAIRPSPWQQRDRGNGRPPSLARPAGVTGVLTGPMPNGDPDTLILWGEPDGKDKPAG